VIGSSSQPGAGIEIEAWSTNFTTTEGVVQWFATFTSVGCYPIRDQFVFPDNRFLVEEFYDLVEGITGMSSSLFDVVSCRARPQRLHPPEPVPPVSTVFVG
jgi:hypothetical protein